MGRWSIRRTKAFASWAAASGLGFAALPVAAQVPVGGEFQVNTYTTSYQNRPSVAAAANGNFVVVWYSLGSSGTDPFASIQAQRYASDGSTQGAQFQVNTYTPSLQFGASVAADADGDFVVAWHSGLSSGTDTSGYSVQGQRYASDGSIQGAQFQVNTYTTSNQGAPSVAADADGDFVVVWGSVGSSGTDTYFGSVQGQRYASDGSTRGAEFQVNTYTTNSQGAPSVAAGADGDFVVVWDSFGSFGTDTDFSDSIQGQRYASDGSTKGAEFQVNTYTTSDQQYPSATANADGDFVVVWRSNGSSGTDTSLSSIQGQRYASDGSPLDAQFQVNTYTTSFQDVARVAVAADGDFVVAWRSSGSTGTDTGSLSIQGQRYASDGSSQGAQFQVNTYTTGSQYHLSVAASADGDFAVVWESAGSSGTDTSLSSIQGQRYSVTAAVPAMSTATRSALAAALLLGAAYALRRRA